MTAPIHDGYKIESPSLDALIKMFNDKGPEIKDLYAKELTKQKVFDCIKILNARLLKASGLFDPEVVDNLTLYGGISPNIHKNAWSVVGQSNDSYSQFNLSLRLYSEQISIDSKPHYLVRFNSMDDDYAKKLLRLFPSMKEYEYWPDDKPEHVSLESWELRKSHWDSVSTARQLINKVPINLMKSDKDLMFLSADEKLACRNLVCEQIMESRWDYVKKNLIRRVALEETVQDIRRETGEYPSESKLVQLTLKIEDLDLKPKWKKIYIEVSDKINAIFPPILDPQLLDKPYGEFDNEVKIRASKYLLQQSITPRPQYSVPPNSLPPALTPSRPNSMPVPTNMSMNMRVKI